MKTKAKVCVECKVNAVRRENSHMCRKCFNVALKDTFRNEKP